MALTTYPGITPPSYGCALLDTTVGIAAGVTNNGQSLPAINIYSYSGTLGGILNLNVIAKGDRILIFVANSTESFVTSVSVSNTTGLVFTEVATGVYLSNPSPTDQTDVTDVTVTFNVTSSARIAVWQIHGSVNYTVDHANSGVATNPSLTLSTITAQNAIAIIGYKCYSAPTITAARQTPPVSQSVNATGVGGPAIYSYATPPLAEGITPYTEKTFSAGISTTVTAVTFYGPTVELDDLTYKLTDTGPLLNNPSSILPIYDVQSVQGIEDTEATVTESAIDGAHGSYISAKYLMGKTVVIDGTLYATPPVDEGIYDDMRVAVSPVEDSVPFYYKMPGKDFRTLLVKPVAFKTDIDRLRSLGQTPYQLQMKSQDARAYGSSMSNAANTAVSSEFVASIAVGGNIETFPILYFNVYTSDVGTAGQYFLFWSPLYLAKNMDKAVYGGEYGLKVVNSVSGVALPSSASGVGYALDFKNLSLTRLSDNVDFSSYITLRNWFSLLSGITNTIKMKRPTASTVTNEGFAYTYADAWR